MQQPTDPNFALETAACLWEAVLTLRDHPATDPDAIDLALQIRASFEAIGTSAMRLIVIGWSDAVDAAWAKVADDYPLSFDWDFVPDWIVRHIDWSDAGAPVVGSDDLHTADGPGEHEGEGVEDGGGKNVAEIREAPMTFPTTIQTAVGHSILSKISRFFNGSALDVLNESIQNSRRAGATRVDIDRIDTDRGPALRIRDDGRGIADPAKFLTLGESGWSEEIARSEDPAGMGVFSLAGRHVTVRSYAAEIGTAWQATIPPQAWESGTPLDIAPCSLDKGTEIEIDLPESWTSGLAQAVKDAARFCPVPIWFGGDRVSQESFLNDATRIEEWNGCRIGIFTDKHSLPRELVRINFHGVTVPCRLPHIVDVDGGRGWYAKVDITDEIGQLQLVLPARKEMVQNAALDALREACVAAIFRTIAREGHHRLSHAHWLHAKSLGVPLPEAAPWLSAWTPSTAETDRAIPGERVAGEPMILMPSEVAHVDQCIARAILPGQPLGAVPVHRIDEFAGYVWYDALPCVLGASFHIERNQDDIFDYVADAQVPPDIVSGRVQAITLELAVRTTSDPELPADILALPADLLIVATGCWNDLDDVAVLLAPECAITPADLACLLESACFYPSEDCDADSYHTQQAAFEMDARFTANMLLLGEDTAIIERVREAVREHVSWLIPNDRPITVRAARCLVEAAFANDDETSVIAAAG